MHTVGRVMEGIFRSLNNLLERFHQSFFFYLLPSSSRYVSIGMYMPSFGILGASFLLTACYLWLNVNEEERQKLKESMKKVTKKDKDGKSKKTKKEEKKYDEKEDEDEESGDETVEVSPLPVVLPSTLTSSLPTLVLSHVMGMLT